MIKMFCDSCGGPIEYNRETLSNASTRVTFPGPRNPAAGSFMLELCDPCYDKLAAFVNAMRSHDVDQR